MGRKLAPEQQTLFVKQLLIEQVMGLVSLAESIETCITNLLYPASYLFRLEGMTITQDVLVFASAIDKDGLAV